MVQIRFAVGGGKTQQQHRVSLAVGITHGNGHGPASACIAGKIAQLLAVGRVAVLGAPPDFVALVERGVHGRFDQLGLARVALEAIQMADGDGLGAAIVNPAQAGVGQRPFSADAVDQRQAGRFKTLLLHDLRGQAEHVGHVVRDGRGADLVRGVTKVRGQQGAQGQLVELGALLRLDIED